MKYNREIKRVQKLIADLKRISEILTQVEDTVEHTYADTNTANRFSGVTEDRVFCVSYYELLTKVGGQYAFCEPTIALSKKNVKLE